MTGSSGKRKGEKESERDKSETNGPQILDITVTGGRERDTYGERGGYSQAGGWVGAGYCQLRRGPKIEESKKLIKQPEREEIKLELWQLWERQASPLSSCLKFP